MVVPSPPPAVVVTPGPQQSTRRGGGAKRPAKTKAKVKSAQARKPERAVVALPRLARKAATSHDGTMLAAGLALFVLVLADTVLLTLSAGVVRRARSG